MRRLTIAAAVFAVALAVASAALAASGLSGTYKDGKVDLAFTKSAFADYFEVNPNAHFYTAVASGSISVTGNTITFKVGATGVAPLGAPCAGHPGTYTFSLTGTTLKFRPVSDTCAARRATLAGTWTKTASEVNTTHS